MKSPHLTNLVKMTETQKKIIRFTEIYTRKHLSLPDFERVEHALKSNGSRATYTAYWSLSDAGMLQLILDNAKAAHERYQYDKVVRHIQHADRSGVREMSKEELEVKSFSAGHMKVALSDGTKWDFLFTVDRNRGREDFSKTQQPWAEALSPYGESLVQDMFKNW